MSHKHTNETFNQNSSSYKRMKVLLLDQRDQLNRKERQNQTLKEQANRKLGLLRTAFEQSQLDFAKERAALEATIAKLKADNTTLVQRVESLNTGMLQSGASGYFKDQQEPRAQNRGAAELTQTENLSADEAPMHLEFSHENKEVFAKYFS